MPFDVAMPLTLFIVTAVTIFLNRKVEGKLKSTLGEREFRVRDAVFLVVGISAIVSLVVFIPQMAVMTVFLFSYSLLLFMFTYLFSDLRSTTVQILSSAYMIFSFVLATLSLITLGIDNIVTYGGLGFYCLSAFAFLILLYEEIRLSSEERWYLAVLPPASFVLLYLFFSRTPIWFPYILDTFGIVFAVLITLYLGSLFTWKISLVFVTLLTAMDIFLVLFTGSMVSAARHVASLRLPVLITVPTIPPISTEWGMLYMSLGLGDFFFAGLIGIQTLKKFGTRTALFSLLSMSTSFFIFESLMLNYNLTAFPGTLMIILGWIPILLWKTLWKPLRKLLRKLLPKCYPLRLQM